MTDLIEWYFNSSKHGVVENVTQDVDQILNSTSNQYIVMHNIKLQQEGMYWCEMGDTAGSVYYLHVDNNVEAINIVFPDTAPNASHATSAANVPEYELEVYTSWTTWTSCSTCDAVGIKTRYGYCVISGRTKSWSKTEEDATSTVTINETLKNSIKTRLKTALLLFKNTLPCKSKFVPKQIQTIPAIRNRTTEVMRQYCKKKCRKQAIFEVRDEKGNVLERANNSAGIYSLIQGIPQLLPSVERNIIYAKRNKKIKLVCPGNLKADIPVVWHIGKKAIISSQIEQQSNGRIRITPQMHILVTSLKFEDANIYSCWQNNEVAGIIKLNVSEEVELKLNHHVILISLIFILSVILIVFWRAFKRQMRFTMY
ncbi:uncharacterized protein LOC109853763 [Pseudomyrmex gracilis]|uniref:uncharacterized protein LOC109853763 n=1 Tax=Pseudomyrmex gracilis TaxID=219809 RepID=UPI000995772E|nr:uncharacterized protein LOC109853763 [Pseudomyrmex gracilis]